ncbi:MAG TPA: hypothetical protein VKD72_27250 [Gemmataceae bacterium]|nr:hypothetical protein [Gemmataceae bacterium]
MQSAPWIVLLKKLPVEQHNQLVLVTTSGIEMAIQTVLVLEGECLVFKGRVSGCQDAGRLFYVPYDRIEFVGFSRVVTEEEFKTWYGDNSTVGGNGSNGANGQSSSTGVGTRTPVPNRAALLERIRTRPSSPGT